MSSHVRTVIYGAALAVIGHVAHDAHEPPRDTDTRRKVAATVPRVPGSDHIEIEEVQANVAAGVRAEVRPLAMFDDTDSFMNPMQVPWRQQPQVLGSSPLPLLMGYEA